MDASAWPPRTLALMHVNDTRRLAEDLGRRAREGATLRERDEARKALEILKGGIADVLEAMR